MLEQISKYNFHELEIVEFIDVSKPPGITANKDYLQ
jgi:hypothetical protein